MTSLSSFSGLTSADIASLFGTSSSSDATTKDSDTTSPAATKAAAGPASGTQITGAGSNAAKAIQSIVTKLQVEKMQTNAMAASKGGVIASTQTTLGATQINISDALSTPQIAMAGTTSSTRVNADGSTSNTQTIVASATSSAQIITDEAYMYGDIHAVRASSSVVTTEQLATTQTDAQGNVSTLNMTSISATSNVTLQSGPLGESHTILTANSSVTALDSTAVATSDTTAGAVNMLSSQVDAQAAQIENAQGDLVTGEEGAAGGQTSTLVTFTSNSLTAHSTGVVTQGREVQIEENALSDVSRVTEDAKTYQVQPSTASSETDTSTNASSDDANSGSSSSSGTNGSALYIEISSWQNIDLDEVVAKEHELVSAFLNGMLSGQNGTTPQAGDGFSYAGYHSNNEGDTLYNISGTVISNYDPTSVTDAVAGQTERNGGVTPVASSIEQSATMGGTKVTGGFPSVWQWITDDSNIGIVIPLESSQPAS